MKSRSLLSLLTFVLVISACNLPSNAPATETLTPIWSPTPTLFVTTPVATQTALPAATSPATATSTPTVPVAFPGDVAVNCRLGPGTAWAVLSGLSVGTSAQITGRSGDGAWWQIADPLNSSRRCWVSSSVTNTAGNLAGIPVVEAPAASVTDLTVRVFPNAISAAVCPGAGLPLEISGTIETNGPTTVTWHIETQQGGDTPSSQTVEFDSFGTTEFSTYYTPLLAPGTYWVRLVTTGPNNMQAETQYTITCP